MKSLRNYDESGLLPAAYVDPQSGYRYYRLEQLARADAIRSLRMVGMPLPQIAETLDGEKPEEVLASHLAALEQQRDEIDQMARQLQRRISLKEYVMSNEITIKSQPAIVAASYRTKTTYSQIFTDIPAGFDRVMGVLTEQSVDPAGIPFTLYYQAPEADAEGDIAMSVPIGNEIEDLGDDVQGVDIIELPAGPTASVLHRGSYGDMGASYAAVSAWILEHGHRIVGPNQEVYLNSPAEVSEADLLTEIHFPIDEEGDA